MMGWMLGRLVLGSLVIAGCVRSSAVVCDDGTICADGTVCATFEQLHLCVDPDQQTACDGLGELDECCLTPGIDPCPLGERGTCHGGTCLPIGCGNAQLDDPLYGTDEECDDGNQQSFDGCSSTCKTEFPIETSVLDAAVDAATDHAIVLDVSRATLSMFGGATYGGHLVLHSTVFDRPKQLWQSQPTLGAPTSRYGHAMAYDAKRERVVMFGGHTANEFLDDTWEWNGSSWKRFDVATHPPPRVRHAMAYDATRGVTVLFGGADADATELGDTWEWDGTAWAERPAAIAPAGRFGHSLTYDPSRGVVVMVGEVRGSGRVETWEYDGEWRDLTTATTPPFAKSSTIAFDGVDRQIVLFGGEGATTGSGTWLFDGAGWTRSLTATEPPGLSGTAAAIGLDGRVTVFGGLLTGSGTASPALKETWRWDGAVWQQSPNQPTPPALASPACNDPALALDQHRRRVVVVCTSPVGTQTWELDGEGWHLENLGASANPQPLPGRAMAYDVAHRQVVMFGGGNSGSPPESTTWLWDGSQWIDAMPAHHPGGLAGAMMAYDASRQQVVLFGGEAFNNTLSNQTWIWDGSDWTQKLVTGPEARHDGAMGYDPVRKTIILHGGLAVLGLVEDTWEWDGSVWNRLAAVSSPPPRSKHALAWNPARQRLVLVGGTTPDGPTGDVWEWTGTDWTPIPATVTSNARIVATESFDGSGVIFVAVEDPTLLAATLLSWRTNTVYEACEGTDHDGDRLTGCADPDCWARCTPTCPPGTTCNINEPHCGDGTCDAALEDCRLCPIDCGACPVICGDFVCSAGEDCPGDCAAP